MLSVNASMPGAKPYLYLSIHHRHELPDNRRQPGNWY